ncbi:MAG: pantetheine-phosphate adenylyltransferase [Nitrospinota bacterium]
MLRAVYPGTFDPVSSGHIDLMRRGTTLFDEVIVAVALNENKAPTFNIDERVGFIEDATKDFGNIRAVAFDGLLVDFLEQVDARIILKGLRAVSDFEYELQMSSINRRLSSKVETVLMMPSEKYSFVSSTVIREIAMLGGDVSSIAPANVVKALKIRYSK